MPQIVLERLPRLPAVAWNQRGACLLPLLESTNAWQVPREAARKMRKLELQGRQLIEQTAIVMRTVATIRENSQPSIRPRSSASMAFQEITRGSG